MSEFEKRMIDEYIELSTRLQKLNKFLSNPTSDVDKTEEYLLKRQRDEMTSYAGTLLLRIQYRGLEKELIDWNQIMR